MRLKFSPARCCPSFTNFTVASIQLLLSTLSGTILSIGYFLFCRSKKVNLVKSFSMTEIHDILQEIFEKILGYVMFIAGFCVTGSLRKSRIFHI